MATRKSNKSAIPAATEGVSTVNLSELNAQAVLGNGKAEVVDTRHLTVMGKDLEVRFFKSGAVTFGPETPTLERVFLNVANAAFGFVHGVGYAMNDKYPVLVRGAHLKFPLGNTNYYLMQDAGYINWRELEDEAVLKFLASRGIAPKEDIKHWLVLKIVDKDIYPSYPVDPTSGSENLHKEAVSWKKGILGKKNEWKDGDADPEITESEMLSFRQNNNKAWDQRDLHRGMEMLFDCLDGSRNVTVYINARFEGARQSLGDQIRNLWESAEVQQAAVTEAIQTSVNHQFTTRGAVKMDASPAVRTVVGNAVDGGVPVFVNDVPQTVAPEALVKASIQYFTDGYSVGHDFFRNVSEAKYGCARAIQAGKEIHVLRFAK